MSEQELILRTLEKLGEATATIARLTSELAEARAAVAESVEHGTAGWARVAESAHELGELRGTVIGLREQLAEARAEVHSVRSTLCERANQVLEAAAELADLRKRVAELQPLGDAIAECRKRQDALNAASKYTVSTEEFYRAFIDAKEAFETACVNKNRIVESYLAARREQSATVKGDE